MKINIIKDDLILVPSNTLELYALKVWHITHVTQPEVARVLIDDTEAWEDFDNEDE